MKRSLKLVATFVLIAGLISGTILGQRAEATVPGANTLISVNNTGDGQGGNGRSPHNTNAKNESISADGKYVVFTSNASNLVSGDTNGHSDVFVRNLDAGTTTRVDVSSSGVQANDNVNSSTSQAVAISSTGRYVVFTSNATNLIDGQTTPAYQAYIHDTITGVTSLVSKNSSGAPANRGVDEVDGVSSDGRFVVWKGSLSTNLVSTETNTISYFVYLTDLQSQNSIVLNHAADAGSQYFVSGITMSCDGSFVAFSTRLQLASEDTDSTEDIYLVDLRNGMTISGVTTTANTSGYDIFPSLSCSGDYLTFQSKEGADLITSGPSPNDTYSHQLLYDRVNDSITLVDTSTSGAISNANSGNTYGGTVDDRGNVVFGTGATNMIDGHTAIGGLYLKHKDTQETELVSRALGGTAWTGAVSIGATPSISADGKTVIYLTGASATTLLSSDTNGFGDVVASSTGL